MLLDFLTPNPNNNANIQILFSPPIININAEESIGHWICTKYDGKGVVHIYDSLNLKFLDNDQINFLNKINPFDKKYQYHLVQQQPDLKSCGAFAIYFATLLCFGKNPNIDILRKKYDVAHMRNHIWQMLNQKKISRFPENGYLDCENNSITTESNDNQLKNNTYDSDTNDVNEIDKITESLQRTVSLKYDSLEQNELYNEQNIHQLFKNNKGQGKCLYRAFADLIENNENKWPCIKIFIINEILKNIDVYGPLVFKGVIGIKDKYNNFMPTPKVIEFPKMVAEKGKWGNEGSLYVISTALNLNIVTICIDSTTGELTSIIKYSPETAKSYTPLTLINIIGTHYVAAH
ncbi:hypothetical protein KQX54_006060 [Cotesia glomerata]|uniref:Uncharacterized protein n=1 Tax=Cotesia glomerata TaxID=32391 RepID=A0AAV7IYX2_COTGL|nr:hypothetical protein KQX54_006060 [Cotesia glomerata]